MDLDGSFVEDSFLSVRRGPAGLFDHERKGIRFVKKAEFSIRVFFVRGIKEYAALEEIAVKVGDKASDVSRATSVSFEFFDVVFRGVRPAPGASFVYAVNSAAFRHADVFVREQKFPDPGVKRKAVHPAAGRVDEHGGRAVDYVSG